MIVKLVKTYKKEKATFPGLVAPKIDGVRCKRVGRGPISRRGNTIRGISHIIRQLEKVQSTLDGELTVPNSKFDSASGLVRNFFEEPSVIYNIFDVPSSPFTKRLRYLFLNELFETHKLKSDTIKLVPHHVVYSHDQVEKYYERFLKEGHEGLIYYDQDSLYLNNRNYEWMRMVPSKSADCKVIGLKPGEGKNEGSLGAIYVDYKGKSCKVGTGFKEKPWEQLSLKEKKQYLNKNTYDVLTRQHIWDNKNEFIDVIAECSFKEETLNGLMRQSSFKGWRHDK